MTVAVMMHEVCATKTTVELIFVNSGRGLVTEVAQALSDDIEYVNAIQKEHSATLKIGPEQVAVRLLDEKTLSEALLNTKLAVVLLEKVGLSEEGLLIESSLEYENPMCTLSVEDAAKLLGLRLQTTDDESEATLRLMPKSAVCLSIGTQGRPDSRIVAQLIVKTVDILSRRMDIAKEIVAQAQKRDNQ